MYIIDSKKSLFLVNNKKENYTQKLIEKRTLKLNRNCITKSKIC